MQSTNSLQAELKRSLSEYFDILGDSEGRNLYTLINNLIEKPLLEVVLQQTKGNKSKAARTLGINRGTLQKMLSKHRLLTKEEEIIDEILC